MPAIKLKERVSPRPAPEAVLGHAPTPPPFPNGWYCLGLSRDLRAGEIRSRRFMGRDVVLFRTASGTACLMDAYCPHLGAHLGCGGEIVEESIRCPFHSFRFDTEGKCVATGYGTKPPAKAVARTWPVEEVNGLILAYHDAKGAAPEWRIPELERDGWTPLLTRNWEMRGHPQETSENSVDVGHFGVVHGYDDVKTIEDMQADGPYLTAVYSMARTIEFAGLRFGRAETEFRVHVHGFGYSQVDVHVTNMNLIMRHYVLSTPLEDGTIDFRIALSHRRVRGGPLVTKAFAHMAMAGFVHDVHQDFPMWQNKRYVVPPALAEGDGPVGPFRRWAKQFYDAPVELYSDSS